MVFDPQDRDPLPKDTYLSALAQERLLNFSLLWKLNSVQDLEGITAFQGYWLQMQNFLAWYLSYPNPTLPGGQTKAYVARMSASPLQGSGIWNKVSLWISSEATTEHMERDICKICL